MVCTTKGGHLGCRTRSSFVVGIVTASTPHPLVPATKKKAHESSSPPTMRGSGAYMKKKMMPINTGATGVSRDSVSTNTS